MLSSVLKKTNIFQVSAIYTWGNNCCYYIWGKSGLIYHRSEEIKLGFEDRTVKLSFPKQESLIVHMHSVHSTHHTKVKIQLLIKTSVCSIVFLSIWKIIFKKRNSGMKMGNQEFSIFNLSWCVLYRMIIVNK